LHRLFRRLAALAIAIGMSLSTSAQAVQCVTYAREQSGIALMGDAYTWWASAAGHYDRGQKPRSGAVVVFKKHGSMSHGHVAVISKVLSARKVLVDHANWAPHRARGRGQVTTQVVMVDVSPRNDWTQVRVWHEPSGELGQRVYPTYGFIYAKGRGEQARLQLAADIPAVMPGIDLGADDDADRTALPGLLTTAVASSVLPVEPGFAQ